MSVMLYPCILFVALLKDLLVLCVAYLTVFVIFLVKHFAIYLGCGSYFAVQCYGSFQCGLRCSVGLTVYGVPKCMCGCCACDPSVYVDVPSIGFVYVCRNLSHHLRVESWITCVCSSHVVSVCHCAYYLVG